MILPFTTTANKTAWASSTAHRHIMPTEGCVTRGTNLD